MDKKRLAQCVARGEPSVSSQGGGWGRAAPLQDTLHLVLGASPGQPGYPLAVWSWARTLSSLCLRFLVCKLRIVRVPSW